MRAIPRKVLLKIREALEDSGHTYLAAALDRALEPKRGLRGARKARASKLEARRAATTKVREAVLSRANAHCEACLLRSPVLELDHFFGGANRRALESVETCWALCPPCHRLKTANEPSAAWWLKQFHSHAAAYGYVPAALRASSRFDALELLGRTD